MGKNGTKMSKNKRQTTTTIKEHVDLANALFAAGVVATEVQVHEVLRILAEPIGAR